MRQLLIFVLILIFASVALAESDEPLLRGIQHFKVGVEPYELCTGDFNNDGNIDAATGDYGSETFSVIFGNGDGTFSAPISYGLGYSVYGLAVGDVNNDNYDDIIAHTSYDIYVCLSNGDGTFADSVNIPFEGYAHMIALVDLNHDNFLDMAVTSYDSSVDTTKIFLNNQSGGFTQIGAYENSQEGNDIEYADLNGDSHIDLVVVDAGTDSVAVMLNDGTGAFTQTKYYVYRYIEQCFLCDLNDDGFPDLGLYSDYEESIKYYINDQSGGFTYDHETTGIERSAEDLTAGDFNKDGNVDILLTQSDHAELYFADNDGYMTLVDSFFLGTEMYDCITADVDNDTYDDLLVVGMPYDYSSEAAFVAALINDQTGHFINNSYTEVGVEQLQGLISADIDNDGDYDLVGSTYYYTNPDHIYIMENDGAGNFSYHSDYPIASQNAMQIYNADFNNDHYDDLVLTYWNLNYVTVFISNGPGTYANGVNLTVGSEARTAYCADMDGDNDIDIIAANYAAKSVSVLKNNGSGVFDPAVTTSLPSYPTSVVGADFFGDDGDIDLIFTERSTDSIMILHNDGTGALSGIQTILAGDYPIASTAGDFDVDGDIDLVVANNYDNTFIFFENDNKTGFFPPITYNTGGAPICIESVDFDNDGDLDLAVMNENDFDIQVFYNDGSGVFSLEGCYMTTYETENMTIADYNNDGYADIAFNDYNNGRIGFIFNNIGIATEVVDPVDIGLIPSGFVLEQNYPNPFNPTTTIEFSLPEKADVNLSIYNILGQKVKEFDLGLKPVGSYKLEWNGKDDENNTVASGIYLYRLATDKFVATKKMVLLK